eukprot:2884542-Rhodomonas_salina.1
MIVLPSEGTRLVIVTCSTRSSKRKHQQHIRQMEAHLRCFNAGFPSHGFTLAAPHAPCQLRGVRQCRRV